MDRAEIAQVFERIAQILELKGENVFKVRAYQNAARTLEGLDEDLEALVESGEIKSIRGIGKNLAEHIGELLDTGRLEEYEELRKSVPEGVLDMLAIQGLGPKKVRVLWEKLGIKTVATLELVCRQGRIAELPGFGEKTQEKILQGIQFLKRFRGQHLFCDAYAYAAELLEMIAEHKKTIRAEIAGSIRRRREIIGDIDILASSKDSEPLMELFTSHESVEAVTAKGKTKSSVVLKNGINADLRVVADDEFPFALHYFTGSKDHNVAMRKLAKKRGLKLSEYGLFKGKKPTPCKDETAIFKALGLDYIEPELRENMGEMEAAAAGTLPELVEWNDIKGILHVHSNYSDGTATIEEMATEAKELGMTYLGIADHSESASYAGGLTAGEIEKQHGEIDRLNKKLKGFVIFKGIECDITKDGTLDYDASVRKKFDFVIASVHSNFNMDERTMTRRICRAMEDPCCNMLAHPTGRLLLSREGYAVDLAKIIDCAAANSVCIEINANPYRLDLDWRWCRRAKEKGVKLAINPDAHSPDGLQHTVFGVGIARKGWLEKDDVLNTMTSQALARYWCPN
jgi:DNA polymerase (family 10)